MAATVRLNEYNGVGATETAGITTSKYGNTDAANLTPANFPITPGNNSYEKWQKLEVTAMGGVTSVRNIKVWVSGALSGSDAIKTNARTATYGGAEVYAQPVSTVSTVADQAMPSSEPGSANLGIGGSLSGELTAIGKSDYLVHQLQTHAATVAGATPTLNVQWEEVA